MSKWLNPEINNIDKRLFPLPLLCGYTRLFFSRRWTQRIISHSAAYFETYLTNIIQTLKQKVINLGEHLRKCAVTWKFNIFRRISCEKGLRQYHIKKRQRKTCRPLGSELHIQVQWRRCRDSCVHRYEPGTMSTCVIGKWLQETMEMCGKPNRDKN